MAAMIVAVMSFAQAQLLPDLTYSNEPATVKGKIKGMNDSNKMDSVTVSCTPSWATDAIVEKVKVNVDGTFEAQFDVCVNSLASVSLGAKKDKPFYIVPGETVSLTVDLAKSQVECAGPLAKLNNSLANYYEEYNERGLNKEINGMGIRNLKGFTVRQYKDKLMSMYNEGVKKLNDDKRLSAEFREYMLPFYQHVTVALMSGYKKILAYANQGKFDEALPADYYDGVKDWNITSRNGFLYAHGGTAATMADMMSQTTGGKFTVPASADQVVAAKKYMAVLDNMKALTDADLAAVKSECPAFENMLSKQNEVTLAKIEENNKNHLFTVKSIDANLSGEDVFKAIVKDYKGKTVLVDFWATWCGPCRAAMKTILPVKEELWGKAAFVYVTGETSPKALWNKMIPEIHGDHYYVTASQWDTLLKQFDAQGIPAYVVVDKDGNVMTTHIGYPGNDALKEELSK